MARPEYRGRIKPGEWDFAGFYPRPPPIARSSAEHLRNIYGAVIGAETSLPLDEKEAEGLFNLHGFEVNINHMELEPYYYGLGDQDGPSKMLKRHVKKLRGHIREHFPGVSIHTNYFGEASVEVFTYDISVPEGADIGWRVVHGDDFEQYWGRVFPILNRSIYQVVHVPDICATGVIRGPSKMLDIVEIMPMRK